MNPGRQFANVAVAGPLRQSFTYRLPPLMAIPQPGQRVIVPFGSTRKMGFYLGPATPPPGIRIKEVHSLLDDQSLIPNELFQLCRWMAEYYFANPFECLAATLPPPLKSKRSLRYRWAKDTQTKLRLKPDGLEQALSQLIKPGRHLSTALLLKLRNMAANLPRQLLHKGMIVEDWSSLAAEKKKKLTGYKMGDRQKWERFFEDKKKIPKQFDGVLNRAQLKAAGWSDYRIRQALTAEVLQPIFQDYLTDILKFIDAREDVESISLNSEQLAAVKAVTESFETGFQAHLLHGVTGSGKTIVYCHLCRLLLERGRTALVLTPEVTLTGTTLAYFRSFFGDRVTVIHSSMTHSERMSAWQGIRSGQYRIVIGPRSAIFAPLPNLGLIVVDEEHDGSYKQSEPRPRFHARDCAVKRAQLNDIPVLLGSATPSLESYHNVQLGRYQLLRLTKRPGSAALPKVTIVDMKKDRIGGDLQYLSYTLKKKIESKLNEKNQVILYLNRRGHSPFLKCSACGFVPSCVSCRVNLTYHRVGSRLSCHYCGYVAPPPDTCPTCGDPDFNYRGVGTQKIEEILPRLFTDIKVLRLDSDSASGRRRGWEIIRRFARREADLLLGTQMVTKGLDLPGVSLVGVISADQSLDMPDFRAAEKSFARLLQVSGRAGRSDSKGEVLIQTWYADSKLIADAATQDYISFYNSEIKLRKSLGYPPFTRLLRIILSSKSEPTLLDSISKFTEALRMRMNQSSVHGMILGPVECPFYYLRQQYRRHLFIKTNQIAGLGRMLTRWETSQPRFGISSKVKLIVDVDPDDMM